MEVHGVIKSSTECSAYVNFENYLVHLGLQTCVVCSHYRKPIYLTWYSTSKPSSDLACNAVACCAKLTFDIGVEKSTNEQ